MDCTWDILTKELAIYGIKLINEKECAIIHEGKFVRTTIPKTLQSLRLRMEANGETFEELLGETIQLLSLPQSEQDLPLDELTTNLFINSLKSTKEFFSLLVEHFEFNDNELKKQLLPMVQSVLNKDLSLLSKDIVFQLPNFKISLDWVFRKMSMLDYVRSLLRLAQLGPNKIEKMNIKLARGVSGPWANLDLPLLERKFPWADIAEENEGRQRDKRRQARYRMGFENYNDPLGRAGCGRYWREMRNEPFSWASRGSDSPYPSRNLLSGWG